MAGTSGPIWYAEGLVKLPDLRLDNASDTPLYKQLASALTGLIERRVLRPGEKLPPTRDLAGQLGLNRATVSAAYALVEDAGLIEGQVGRGSFVSRHLANDSAPRGRDWEAILPPVEADFRRPQHPITISFASSRPADDPRLLADFRRLAREVIEGPDTADILQLGSAYGYAPLRRFLLQQALDSGVARSGDDVMITNGCQQGLDLIARVLSQTGPVAVEDPAYRGTVRVFSRGANDVIPVPVDNAGVDPDALEALLMRHKPVLLVVTPSFQNPTGVTLSIERRKQIVLLAQRHGSVLVENDIYSELRYAGSSLPTLKELDDSGNTILLRSYSKIGFPGLRVGWVIAARPVIARLAEIKEMSDLHSDQLSQAVLLRFAASGELNHHLARTRKAGAQRLETALNACEHSLPAGSRFTRPQGGMSLWIELPHPLTAEAVLNRSQEMGVTFLTGRYFSSRHQLHARCLRLCFGALSPDEIGRGLEILGQAAKHELAAAVAFNNLEPATALV